MIIYGRNAVREALRGRRAARVRSIWATAAAAREPWLADAELHDGAQIAERCGSPDHQGVCADAGEYPYVDAHELLALEDPLILALDQVQDPQNLGSICRTAECAGAAGVVVLERRAAHVTAAVCKASAGAVEHLPVAMVGNLASFLGEARDAGLWSYGASADAPDGLDPPLRYDTVDYSGAGTVLVLGSEGSGLRPNVAKHCDALIALPQRGRVASLNVGAAAAALVYGILQKKLDTSP